MYKTKRENEHSVVITWKKKKNTQVYIQMRAGLLKQVRIIEYLTEIVIIVQYLVLIHK